MNPTKKTLHALLIGINDYPPPVKSLKGCRNDAEGFDQYFRSYANSRGWAYRPLTLFDQQAGRQNIIEGFGHFDAARDGDVCLLFYAGHGSQWKAPEALSHIEPDLLNESLVCYDSRLEGGRDLIDKELRWLIWKANKGKNLHFVAIMDCCHSGTNVRKDYSNVRMATMEDKSSFPLEEFLGFEDYIRVNEKLTPPMGKYIHLAAARAEELSKEIYTWENLTRGAFSMSLLETLVSTGGALSYLDIHKHVNARIRNLVSDQSPQVEASHSALLKEQFLTGYPLERGNCFLVHNDRKTDRWLVNAGSIFGITAGEGESQTVFKLIDDDYPVEGRVTKVFGMYSELEGLDGVYRENTYNAVIKKRGFPRIPVAFAPGVEETVKDLLKNHLEETDSDDFQLSEDPAIADYWIQASPQELFLTLKEDKRPLFQRLNGISPADIADFQAKLETVCRWRKLQRLTNPDTSIRDENIEIRLSRITVPGDHTDDREPDEPIDNWQSTVVMPYLPKGQDWKEPAFRLKIKNQTGIRFWVSALYLGDNFGIDNDLCPKEELGGGEELWLKDKDEDGNVYQTIPLRLDDSFFQLGINSIREQIKILVSTEEMDTYHYSQDGLEPDRRMEVGTKRGKGRYPGISGSDWRTFDIELLIQRPIARVPLPMREPLFGLRVQAPPAFTASVSLNTFEDCTQAHPGEVNRHIGKYGYLNPYLWTPGRNQSPGLSVVELFFVEGRDMISRENPLILKNESGFTSAVVPFALDKQSGWFRELAHEMDGDVLRLFELPEATAASGEETGKVWRVYLHAEGSGEL
jgi:hypothetical protein